MSALPEGYSFRELGPEEFQALQQPLAEKIFDAAKPIFRARGAISGEEREKWRDLDLRMGDPYVLRLGLFHHEEFAGWHIGRQQSGDKFYMQNSAILPEHRRQGLYSALVREVLTRAEAQGFQVIYGRHTATNNAVIIPKLKAGFVITSMELSDVFGLLVHLSYYTNSLRRKVLEFRTGEALPDDEVRRALRL